MLYFDREVSLHVILLSRGPVVKSAGIMVLLQLLWQMVPLQFHVIIALIEYNSTARSL